MQIFHGFGLLGTTGTVWLLLNWALCITALFVVPRNRKPTAGMAWLLVIFFFPILGFIIFLILGSPKLPKNRRHMQRTLTTFIEKSVTELEKDHHAKQYLEVVIPEKYKKLAELSTSLTGLPALSGNKLTVLDEYNDAIAHIIKDIDQAKHFVHLEYFIIVLDEVTEPLFTAMGRAVKRGVDVRVMYDSLSTKRYKKTKQLLRRLDEEGVMHQAILPLRLPGKGYVRPDLRNHRKLVIIDGHTGYTGSQNLVRRDYHRKDDIYYDELVVRLQGPAVLELSAVFSTDWFSETGELLTLKRLGLKPSESQSYGKTLAQVLPSGPGYDDENNLKLFTSLIHAADSEITIVNPYFVPDDALATALTSAARRGVKVTMINSEAMDQWMVGHAQRSFYEEMLHAGVRIYLYKKPVLLHSKFITVDDDIATIGSSNLDIRSLTLNQEVTLICYDKQVVQNLRSVEMNYRAHSIEVSYDEWLQRPLRKVLLDNIARITASLQ